MISLAAMTSRCKGLTSALQEETEISYLPMFNYTMVLTDGDVVNHRSLCSVCED